MFFFAAPLFCCAAQFIFVLFIFLHSHKKLFHITIICILPTHFCTFHKNSLFFLFSTKKNYPHKSTHTLQFFWCCKLAALARIRFIVLLYAAGPIEMRFSLWWHCVGGGVGVICMYRDTTNTHACAQFTQRKWILSLLVYSSRVVVCSLFRLTFIYLFLIEKKSDFFLCFSDYLLV